MIRTRTLALGLTVAATALAPTVALAKHGADDPPGDDRGGQVEPGDDNGGGRDDRGGDDRGGQRDDRGGQRARNRRTARGTCTGSSTSKLKVKHDDGRLETEFEVDQNQNGVAWQVTVQDNGRTVISRTATTRAPSGSFSVERKIRNRRGTDRVTARAVSPSGEVCTAAVSI